jgi:hypothetical protein
LLTALEWVLVHVDDRAFIMVRHTPATAGLIQREGYRFIRPWENAPVTPANAPQVLEEANRALRHCPDGATFAHAYKANALYQLGFPTAAAAARKVPEKLVIE